MRKWSSLKKGELHSPTFTKDWKWGAIFSAELSGNGEAPLQSTEVVSVSPMAFGDATKLVE